MFERIVRAIRLDKSLYREAADLPALTSEGALIAVGVALISSLGMLGAGPRALFAYLAQVANSLLFGWILWSLVAYFVGTRFFKGRSNVEEMLRVLGYANAPRLLGVLGFIPCVGWLFSVTGWVLSVIAGVIAIREAMEFETSDAVITALVSFVLYIIASVTIGLVFAGLSLPFHLLTSL